MYPFSDSSLCIFEQSFVDGVCWLASFEKTHFLCCNADMNKYLKFVEMRCAITCLTDQINCTINGHQFYWTILGHILGLEYQKYLMGC